MQKGCSPLLQWLKNITPPLPKCLIWCHTTDAWTLRNIIKNGSISPKQCPIFEEDLSYFFYGRPAFRMNSGRSEGQSSKAPIVILLHPQLIKKGTRLFPFDSGAFANNRYEKWMHPHMEINDFELNCTDQTPPAHVSAFFETNNDYLNLCSKPVGISYEGEFEVESLIQLLSDTHENADDRRLAMELQTKNDIPLNSSNVLALIIPSTLIEAPWFDEFMKKDGLGIDLIHYNHSPKRQAIQYQSELENKAIEIQKNRDLI